MVAKVERVSAPVAQFLWVKGKLSTMERACFQSFLNIGYEVHLYHYEAIEDVPSGVMLKSGTEILAADRLFLASGVTGQSYAAFSDLFRYHLLRQKGGWWFDCDILAIRKLPDPTDLYFASSWEAKWQQVPSNCAIWARPGDERIVWLCNETERIIAQQEIDFGLIGPRLVVRLVKEQQLAKHIAPWWEFSPYPWRMIQRVAQRNFLDWSLDRLRAIKQRVHEKVDSDFKAGRIRSGTRAIHLHNEIWKLRGMRKDEEYFRLCLWERLKQQIFQETERT